MTPLPSWSPLPARLQESSSLRLEPPETIAGVNRSRQLKPFGLSARIEDVSVS